MNPTFGSKETGKSEKSLTIETLFPPTELTLSMDGGRLDSTTLSVVNANNVSIECTSDGYPPPIKRWEYGLNIYNGSFLTLTNIQATDAGTYICVVENTMTPTFGPETIGRSNLSIQLVVQDARSNSLPTWDLLFSLIGAGCGLLLLAAIVLACVCRTRKIREISVANKRNVELQPCKERKRVEDFDDVVENPMYISADDVLAHEHSSSQANGQVGQTKIYSSPYDVHKVENVVDEVYNHYAEIID
ncbi:uncharacterized protein LOC127850074 isoform X2 [Dreissena polymorpha]|uniref:uncharacterized protein LOC127850074 isoform X2 n=1 Tax=Dreissena polymorpha TaxID=45954 RepID=UPI002263C950|nr:uncharacterized protein LOC127850074 isoform X2 [Dreissena polymorpha]